MNTILHTRTFTPVVAMLLMLALSACDSNDALSDSSDGDRFTPSAPSYSVKYTVTSQGDGEVASITYRDPEGTLQTVENPTLPWSASYVMHSGDQVSLSVVGTATTGALYLSLSAIGEHKSFSFNNGCGEAAFAPFNLFNLSCDNLNADAYLP